ncbi:MAG: hypothetical protein KJ077_08270 [Anaerolineae bacterium]|nr:hypothetical protein [Anaerolineae bacterium]
MKRFQSIHVIIGVLDDRRPAHPHVCRPFTIPAWVLAVILILGMVTAATERCWQRLAGAWNAWLYQVGVGLLRERFCYAPG